MTERNNDEGRRTPRPSRKRPEDSCPETQRTRKPRPEASETRPGTARPQQGGRSERARSDRTERSAAPERRRRPETLRPRPDQAARRRAEQEDAEHARAQRRRRRRLRRRVYRVLLAVLAVVFVLSAAMIARGALKGDGLKGSWALEEGTVYEFDGKGGGTLRLPTGSYAFSYTIEDNVVTLDFADESLNDASYSFLLGRDALTLDTNTGTVYWLKREGR